jgi:uncharacterized protein (TIGR03435 family)
MRRAAFVLLVSGAFGQQSAFEVVSVKPAVWTPGCKHIVEDNARIEHRCEVVFNLLYRAYGVQGFQILGPAWIKQDRFDVLATLPSGASKADIPAMLRKLLADEFHLTIRRELRPTPVYAITVAKDGPKLQPCRIDADECPHNRSVTVGESIMTVHANTLAGLADDLSPGVDRPIFDRTGLIGKFRIELECEQSYMNSAQDDPRGLPTMSAALQKLGLKLESRREDVEYVVVERK